MTKCKCGVTVDEALQYCPLCRRKCDVTINDSVSEWYPPHEALQANPAIEKNQMNIIKSVLFTTIAICCLSVLINFFVTPKNIWCLFPIITAVYAAFTVIHTICSNAHLGIKILFQIAGITGVLLGFDLLLGFSRWSVNFVFPFLIIAATTFVMSLVFAKKRYLYEFIEFIVALLLLAFMPFHLYVLGTSNVLWPAVIAECHALLTFAGLFIFANQDFKNEIKKRFHF